MVSTIPNIAAKSPDSPKTPRPPRTPRTPRTPNTPRTSSTSKGKYGKHLPMLENSFQTLDDHEKILNGKFKYMHKSILFDLENLKRSEYDSKIKEEHSTLKSPRKASFAGSTASNDSIMIDRTIIKGIDISTLEEDINEDEKIQLEKFKKNGSNFIEIERNEIEKCIPFKTYSSIPPDVELSSSLQYFRKEQEHKKVHLMFERASLTQISKRKKKRSRQQNNLPAFDMERDYLNGIDSSANTSSTQRNSGIHNCTIGDAVNNTLTKRRKKQSNPGELNRIRNDLELFSRPLAGMKHVDWNKLLLGPPKNVTRIEDNSATDFFSKHRAVPHSSALERSMKKDTKFEEDSSTNTKAKNEKTMELIPSFKNKSDILQGSRKRKNYMKERSLFEKLSTLNSTILDHVHEDLQKRSASLKNDVVNIVQAVPQIQSTNDYKASDIPLSPQSKYSQYFRFKLQLKYETDISQFLFHVQFYDFDRGMHLKLYNLRLNSKNFILWKSKETIFSPFDQFSWLQTPEDLENQSIHLLVTASVARIIPPEKDTFQEEEEDIFSKAYRGGIVRLVNSYIHFSLRYFRKQISSKGQILSYKCTIGSKSSQKEIHTIKEEYIHRRSLVSRQGAQANTNPFNEFQTSRKNRPERRVPHTPLSRSDSFRPDLSNIDPFESLRKHPLFKMWKPEASPSFKVAEQTNQEISEMPSFSVDEMQEEMHKDRSAIPFGKPPLPNTR